MKVTFIRAKNEPMNLDIRIEDNLFYHVYNRGNDRQRIFGDASDYRAFVEKMKSLAVRYLVHVSVYALMPNHYHLIVQQQAGGNLSRMMGALATSAAKRYNLKYAHIGHLFQGPFRHKLVGEDALWYVACYIHLNPVRARLVAQPEKWRYSNFGEGFLRQRKSQDEGNLHLWRGYPMYVQDVLKNERMQRELRKMLQSHVEGFLPPEGGHLQLGLSRNEGNL